MIGVLRGSRGLDPHLQTYSYEYTHTQKCVYKYVGVYDRGDSIVYITPNPYLFTTTGDQ